MAGLDPGLISSLNKEIAFKRVLVDVNTDFIFAPQYKLLLEVMQDELWEDIIRSLRSGRYQSSPLITAEVPKPSGLTRPGSILFPADRVLFQALADYIAIHVDPQLDDGRVFSYRLLNPDPAGQMFDLRNVSYDRFKAAIEAGAASSAFAIRADVASYFIHINHHVLENLLTSAGVPAGMINLLVGHMLEAWSGRYSNGIPQGLFPSDVLGNYYLSGLDTFLAAKGVPSVRYVDDLVMFHDTEELARMSIPEICRFLRTIGLDLNESKTNLIASEMAVQEETELDRLFEAARDEVYEDILEGIQAAPYGFQDQWETIDDSEALEISESEALERLWAERSATSLGKRDQLDRFCIGTFTRLRSRTAVATVLAELGDRSHMTRQYCVYLATFVREDADIQDALCKFVSKKVVFDSELQWPMAAMMTMDSVPPRTITETIRILKDRMRSTELRALSATLIGKFGNGPSRTVLRSHWDEEDSDHVKAAMVFSLMYFGKEERNILLTHWGSQNRLFALVANAVRKVRS